MVLLFPAFACGNDDDLEVQFGFQAAAAQVGVSVVLLKAISMTESSHDQSAINTETYDGNPDMCHMQIHEGTWRKHYTDEEWNRILTDTHYCTLQGAEILRSEIDRYGNDWNAVAAYHTGRSLESLAQKAQGGTQEDKDRYLRAYEYCMRVWKNAQRYLAPERQGLMVAENNPYEDGANDQTLER